MQHLPFRDNHFDKTVSITALEFIADAGQAIWELFRVTRPGGVVVVATLNSRSSWAARRREKATRGERHILENAFYRSGPDLLGLVPYPGISRSVVHFQKEDDVQEALCVEAESCLKQPEGGAFVAVRWQKP